LNNSLSKISANFENINFIFMQSILTHLLVDQKITRLAHQIIENCHNEQEVFLGGICGNGIVLAEKIKSIIEGESELKIHVFEIKLDKIDPLSHPITLSVDDEKLENAFIILIDDVINSGVTMQYALKKILQKPTKSIKTVVLIDRMHRRYPIKADFVGMSLSTTLKERVEVYLEPNSYKAILV
jgi:pyrimidine operon attenuation protein/uracil phosphoribosyltransferase